MALQAQVPIPGPGLELNIHLPLSPPARKSIINDCWNAGLNDRDFARQYKNFQPYFENYESLCQSCSPDDLGQLRHSDLLGAFNRIVTQSRNTCIGELKALLLTFPAPFSQPQDADEFVRMWIDTTAECLLLLDVHSWAGNQTLKEFLEVEFATQKTSSGPYAPFSKVPCEEPRENLRHADTLDKSSVEASGPGRERKG
ncbi:hypothetical protein PV08_11565 [Exophiala spinifera]|uniref:Uncharacterized protein n=1 Tax=Exophiala spinifera TaxID=91928 RepID=A0A0D1Y6V0_9EURO|nr:uncharacterized protein PV08_11565 [Exophiala spinifera]KIW10601.1 hypothetical protein PV08_11565 [Exophiala spinifera]